MACIAMAYIVLFYIRVELQAGSSYQAEAESFVKLCDLDNSDEYNDRLLSLQTALDESTAMAALYNRREVVAKRLWKPRSDFRYK